MERPGAIRLPSLGKTLVSEPWQVGKLEAKAEMLGRAEHESVVVLMHVHKFSVTSPTRRRF